LRSPSCSGKNILTDFIRKKVLGLELFFATSDLRKVLGKFNSCIQAQKLILLNEAGMASGEWHKANDHLKSLITEP
ncbi:589_t:CDS:1, partial [Funneliformis geosporum]